jgi:hypothetical protein
VLRMLPCMPRCPARHVKPHHSSIKPYSLFNNGVLCPWPGLLALQLFNLSDQNAGIQGMGVAHCAGV